MKIALLNEVNEINKSLEEKKNSECSHSYWETDDIVSKLGCFAGQLSVSR